MKSFWMTFALGVLCGLCAGFAVTYLSISLIFGP